MCLAPTAPGHFQPQDLYPKKHFALKALNSCSTLKITYSGKSLMSKLERLQIGMPVKDAVKRG
jgi:hypothetical protein